MAKFYFIRHGKPDYSYGDEHGFIGHGNDLAPLKQDGIDDVIKTSRDFRLKQAQIIVSSPYTRALQTASIISKETGIEIAVEPDIREWQPDLTYQYRGNDEAEEYYTDYVKNNGVYPKDEKRNWETKEQLYNRVMAVIEKYKENYDTVIIVSHKLAIRSVCDCGKMNYADIFEISF